MRFSNFLTITAAAILFAACKPPVDSAKFDPVASDSVPHAQLPNSVIPQAYRIDMMIDPQADTMSGTVQIDTKINEATDVIWIHAKDMTVKTAKIDYVDGVTADLTFHAIPLEDAPSGIA